MARLTPEYPPEVKPERAGVYKTWIASIGTSGYSLWSGYAWGCEYPSVGLAAGSPDFRNAKQNKHWQGLAEDPYKRADLEDAAYSGRARYADSRELLIRAIEALKETT